MDHDIRKIVREGYEKGDYPGIFRSDAKLGQMERHFLDKILALSDHNPTMLDLGCGTGIPVDRFLVDSGVQLTGIDTSPKHLSLARTNVPAANYVEADFSTFAFSNAQFDAVVSFYAIFHIPRQEHKELFGKVYRILKDGGLFLATLGTSDSEYGEEADWTGAPMAWSNYNPETYQRLLTETGFELIESTFEGQPGDKEYHFWVLSRKSPKAD